MPVYWGPPSAASVIGSDYLTFKALYEYVEDALKQTGGSKRSLIKSVVNMVYLNEIMACDPLYPFFWMVDFDDSFVCKAPATVTGISRANPGVVSASGPGLEAGDIVSLHGVVGMEAINDRLLTVASAGLTFGSVGLTFGTEEVNFGNFTVCDIDGNDFDTSGFGTWTSGGTILHRGSLFSSERVQRILKVRILDQGQKGQLEPTDFAELESADRWLDETKERPTKFFHRKWFDTFGSERNQLMWAAAADATYHMRYWFESRPARLVNDTDVPQLPAQFHDLIVSGAVTRLAESSSQVESGIVWPKIYAEQLESLKSFNRSWWEQATRVDSPKPYLL